MDRLDEELASADIVNRDPDAAQFLIENYGKGFSKYLTEIVKFHERENVQESESTKALSKIYSTLRLGLQTHIRMPMRPYYDSIGNELSHWINSQEDKRSQSANAALEDLKRHRNLYSTKCKMLKEQWKATKARYVEAREAHKAAKANYYRLGREKEKLLPVLSDDANSLGSSDVLDHISSGGDVPAPIPISKRERQRLAAEGRFAEAESEYQEAVDHFRARILERNQCHAEQLASLRQAAVEADDALLRTEERLLRTVKEQAVNTIAKIDQRMLQLKEYRSGQCYSEWTAERMNAPPSLFPVEDESNVVFVPFTMSLRDGPGMPTSPMVLTRSLQGRSGSPAAFELNRRSADLLLENRDSVDGSSDGSTPGSSRKSHCRSSEEIAQKTPELTPTEEEVRVTSTTPAQATRVSWFQKTIKRWANTGPGRTSSVGGSGGSPPPSAGPSLDEEMRAIRQIVVKCVAALDNTGLTTEGLYRKGGSEARTRDIINEMFENPDNVNLDEFPPLVLCAVIKKCFIKMRDPLFTETLHTDFVRVGMNPNAEDAVQDLKKIINNLPAINLEIASIFLRHLHRVAKVEENQMSFDNLGICLAPTLLHQKHVTTMQFQCSAQHHKKPQSLKHSKEIMANLEVKECSRVLSLLIEHVEFLFPKPTDTPDSCPVAICPLESVRAAAEAYMNERKSTVPQPGSVSSAGPSKGSVTDSVWSSGSSSGLGHASWASGSATGRSESSPPPVPPAIGRRKHSAEKMPGKKSHEVRMRSRFASANTTRSCNSDVFDDRLLLADMYAGTSRPNAFQMIDSSGSSLLNIFRRLKSVDDAVDLDKSYSHGYNPHLNGLRSPPSPFPEPFVRNGAQRRRSLGPPPTPPPKPPHLSLSGHDDEPESPTPEENGLVPLRPESAPPRRYIFVRRQSEPNGLSLASEVDIEARRGRRASTVSGAPMEPPTNACRVFVPRRSQPEFV